MATIRERLVYAIDFVSDGQGLKQLQSKSSGVFATIKANAGAAAVALGTGLVAAGLKASEKFNTLAIDAEKFALATGGSTEEMSRWIEVAGDLGLTTDQVQGGFIKLEKAIGGNSPAVEELGLSLQTLDDGSADVTGTMIEAIRALEGVEDPAKKAKLAADLFGRGFADMAELVTGDADEIVAALGRVSDSKIIDAEEVAKAKRSRETLDALRDSGEDLALTFGESVTPVIAGAAEGLAALATAAGSVHLDDIVGFLDDFDDLGTGIGRALRAPFDEAAVANHELVAAFGASEAAARDFDRTQLEGLSTFDQVRSKVLDLTGDQHAASLVALEWKDAAKEGAGAASELATEVGLTADAFVELKSSADPAWDKYIDSQASALAAAEGAPGTFADMEAGVGDLGQAFQDAADNGVDKFRTAVEEAIDAIKTKFSDFRDTLDMQDLMIDIAEQVDAVNEAAEKLGDGGEQEARDYRREVGRLQGQVVDLLETYEDIPPQKITEILTRISQGDVDEILRVIDELTKDRFIRVGVIVPDINNAYDSINTRIGNGAPGPIFNNPNPAPVSGTPGGGGTSAQSFVTINTLTSTPAKQYVDRQIDDRRNGVR